MLLHIHVPFPNPGGWVGPSMTTIPLHSYFYVLAIISSWCISRRYMTLEHSNNEVFQNQNLKEKKSTKIESNVYSILFSHINLC